MSIIGPKLCQVIVIATSPTIEDKGNIGTRKSELTVIEYLPEKKKHLSKYRTVKQQFS